jgi:hypothetical protein
MNISKAARQSLIPIEKEIKSKQIEYVSVLNKVGKILSKAIGNKDGVHISIPSDSFIVTHNHPDELVRSGALSPSDILIGILYKLREVRAVTQDGFCHLVEIPKKMGVLKRIKCSIVVNKYNNEMNDLIKRNELSYSKTWTFLRKMHKELKNFGLKFRTIKLPE